MGVSTNFYTIFGVKLDWNDEFSDAYNDRYDNPELPNVILDGMCGEYIVLGKILWDSGDMRYGFEDSVGTGEIDLASRPQVEAEYREKFLKVFPDFAHLIDKPFKLICLAHYS